VVLMVIQKRERLVMLDIYVNRGCLHFLFLKVLGLECLTAILKHGRLIVSLVMVDL